MPDDFDAFLDDHLSAQRDTEVGRNATAVGAPMGPEPEELAKNRKIGQELGGIPAGVIGAAPQVFQQQLETQRAKTDLTGAPNTNAWLADLENQGLAKDDLSNLTWFERSFGGAGRAAGRGTRYIGAAWERGSAMDVANRIPDVGKTYEDILAEEMSRMGVAEKEAINGYPPALIANARLNATEAARMRFAQVKGRTMEDVPELATEAASRFAGAAQILENAQAIPMSPGAMTFRDTTLAEAEDTFTGTLAAFASDPVGGAVFIGETAAEFLPVLVAAGLVTQVTKTPSAGAALMGAGSYQMELSGEFMGRVKEAGYDITTPEGAHAALQDKELLAEAERAGQLRGFIIGTVDALSGGVAGIALARTPVGDVLVQGIVQTVMAGGAEAGAQYAVEGEITSMKEVVIEGLADLATTPIEITAVGGRPLLRDMLRYSRAGTTQTQLQQVDAMAKASKLKARAPEKFQEALDASGMGDATLNVPASEITSFYQGEISDETLQQMGIDRTDFEAALSIGGDVAIPMSNYATWFSDTELAPILQEHGTLDSAELSPAEARQFQAGLPDEIAAAIARDVEAEQDVDITSVIEKQLIDKGKFSARTARAQASVHGAFWKAAAAKKGMDPNALAARFGLDIQGASDTPSGDALDQGAVGVPAAGPSSPQFKSWFGASQVVDETGSPAPVYHATRARVDFPAFRAFSHFGTARAARQRLSQEEKFGPQMVEMSQGRQRERTIPTYLAINNPLDLGKEMNADGDNWQSTAEMLEQVADTLDAPEIMDFMNKEKIWTNNWVELDDATMSRVEGTTSYTTQQLERELTFGYFDDNPTARAEAEAALAAAHEQIAQMIEAYGYDGIVYTNTVEDQGSRSFVPLRPTQVKSQFNQGTFDPNNPNILHQNSPPLDPSDNRIADGVMTFEESGLPVHLYHGTNQMFSTFRDGRIFLTTDQNLAKQHATRAGFAGARLVEANVVIENPLVIEIPNDMDPDIYWLENALSVEDQFAKPDADGDPYDAIVVHRADGSNVMVIATKNDQVKQLHAEGGTFYQSAAPLQADPIPMLGTGPGGRVLNWDLGTALTERHNTLYDGPLDLENPEHYDMALEHLLDDYAEQQKQPDNGNAWYSDDIAAALETTKEIIPELSDPVNRDIFLTMAAFLSPQQGPVMNWENAILAMRGYLDSPSARIPLKKPNGKNYGVASHANGLRMLQHLIDTMGEVDAIYWLNTEHTGREMAEMRKASGIFKEHKTLAKYTPNEMSLTSVERGVYMLGPKVGDFALNSTGADSQAVTVDLWAARTYNRLTGRLLDVSPGSQAKREVASDVRGKKERDLIKRLFRDAAEQVGIEPSSMQAALWYFEQRLYRAHGIRSESKSFSDAAGASVASRSNTGPKSGAPASSAPGRTGGEPGRELRENQLGPEALDGAPRVRGVQGPDPRLVAVADAYAQAAGIDLRRQSAFAEIDPEFSTRIAQAYTDMEHNPGDPVVAEAYENLIQQTVAQYQALVDAGYKFYFIDLNTPEGQDYASTPWNAMFDTRDNQTMGVFSTAAGFGTDQAFDPADNPMLAETGFEWPMGPDGEMQPVYANDLFRAVHDAFGHGLEFAGFRDRGEENAWQAHVRLFTGSAVAAITSETRGQNSWLNYGPYGETNRTATVEDTVFADQKTGLMPDWTWMENRVGDMNPGPRTLYQNEALANELGMHSGVEQAALRMNVQAFNTSKKNPEGRALGKDIWAKLQKEPGVKKEELQWLGLEEFLTMEQEDYKAPDGWTAELGETSLGTVWTITDSDGTEVRKLADWEANSSQDALELAARREHGVSLETGKPSPVKVTTGPGRHTREEVVAFIRENGVEINELVKEEGGGDAGFVDASEDWTREVITGEEQWEHLVVDMLGDYNANLDETSGIDIDDWMDSWLMQNAETVLDNMDEVIGEIDAEVMAEARQLLEENDPRALIDALDEEVADLRTAFREMARDDFEISANVQAEQEYMQNPDEYAELTTRGGETGLGVFVMGNEEFGYAVAEGRSGEKPTRLVEHLGMNLSFNEAGVLARNHAYDTVDLMSMDSQAQFGEYVMDGDHSNYREHLITLPNLPGKQYVKSQHFSEENVVTFIRSTDRLLGENDFDTSFFVEELQSDWHQDGRQYGYQSEQSKDYLNESITLKRELSEMAAQAWEFVPDNAKSFFTYGEPGASHFQNFVKAAEQIVSDQGWYDVDQKNTVIDAINASEVSLETFQEQGEKLRINRRQLKASRNVVPDAPFKGDGWISLGVKRALIKAVEEGKTSFAWADSNTLIDRWDDQYAELYQNIYDRKMVSLVKKLTGVAPQRFKSDGSENNITRQSWIDRHMIIERDDGLYEIHNIDGKATAMNFDNRLQAESVLESMADDATLIPGYWKIEITDELRAQMTDTTLPLFQDKPDAPRGQIDLPSQGVGKGTSVIRLFEGRDLSTFLHESAHYFLEVMNQLSKEGPEMDADMAAIRKFVKAKDGQNGFTREQHETFARGFEAYLMEGMAPSLELADSFSMFKGWLINIYKSVTALKVNVSPEMRDVFDRMLATDEAIDAARAEMVMKTLFAEKPPSMSETDWQTYQRQARRGEEQAEQRLLKRMMAKITRETKAWYKDEKDAVREEVTGRLRREPTHLLVEIMANQSKWGDDEGVTDIRIDRAQLIQEFGKDIVDDLGRGKLGGKRNIFGSEGIAPEQAAELFGFRNAAEMVQRLQEDGKIKDRINEETEKTLLERHGDPFTDGSIEAEAMDAVHAEQQEATVVAEVRQLGRQLGENVTGVTAKLYRARAKEMIGKMTVAQASKPQHFLAAERKAAKEAERQFAKVIRNGGEAALKAAYDAKQRQALNQALYHEARAVEEEVTKGRKRMMNYRKPSVRAKLEGGYIEQIDALLEQYDFRKRTNKQMDRDERLSEFVARMQAEGRGHMLNIPKNILERAERDPTNYMRVPVADLRALFDTIENIDHMGRFKQSLIDAKEKRDLDKVATEIEQNLLGNMKTKGPGRTLEPGELRRDTFRRFLNLTKNADTFLREIDGFEDLGKAWTHLKQKVDEGMNRVVERRMDMGRRFDKIYGKYSKREKRDYGKKRHIEALSGSFSRWDLISIALNTGNEQNYQRLTNPDAPGSFTPAQLEVALEQLDKRDWETVQEIWDYMEEFWPEIADLEKRSTGAVPPKVDRQSMTSTAPGFVKGGYYPLKYDNRISSVAYDFMTKDLGEELMSGSFGKAQTAQGHTNARVDNVKQPVMIDLGIAHMHVDSVIYDLEMREALTNSWRILHHGKVKNAFLSKGLSADFEALELWLKDTASGERIAASGLWHYMRHLRVGFTVSRLAINLSTALIQPTGLAQSAVVVGKRAIAKGTIKFMSDPTRWTNEVTEVSPMMRERKKTFERDIFNAVGDLEAGPTSGWKAFMRDYGMPASFFLMQSVQFYAVDMPTWVGAYEKELALSGDEARARTYADSMVKRAQGSGLMTDRGMLERGTTSATSRQQEWPKMLTALGSYMFAKGNVAYESVQKTNFKDPVSVMNLAMDLGLLFTLEAVLYSAVKGFLPDEDEDEPEDWAIWLAKETGLSMMSTLPITREAAGSLGGFGGGGILQAVIEGLTKPVLQASQGEMDRALVNSLVDAAGITLHLPSSQAKNAINGIFDEDMGFRRDPNPAEALGLSKPGHGRSIADFIFED